MRTSRLWAMAAWLMFIPSVSQAADRHSGYYYPAPQTQETYKARAQTLAKSGRRSRIAFVTGLTNRMLQNPYPPEFAIFAKGSEAQKLIIVAVKSDSYNTLYRMRALLATLTACSAPGSLDTSLSHAAGLIEIAACHA